MSITSINSSHSGKAFNQLQKSIKLNTEAWLHMSTGESKLHAYDDSTAFAIGNQMKSKVTTLNVVLDGVTQSQEMLNIAEGSMRKLIDLSDTLNTIIARAKQGLVDDNTIKTALAPAFNLTKQEMIRIVEDTEFNGVKLLNGTGGKRNAGTPSSLSLTAEGAAAIAAANVKDAYTFNTPAITVQGGIPSSFKFTSGTVDNTNVNIHPAIDLSAANIRIISHDPIKHSSGAATASSSTTTRDQPALKDAATASNSVSKVTIPNASIVIDNAIIKDASNSSVDANVKITITGVQLEGTPGTMSADGTILTVQNLASTGAIPSTRIVVTSSDSQLDSIRNFTLNTPITFGSTTISSTSQVKTYNFDAITGSHSQAFPTPTGTLPVSGQLAGILTTGTGLSTNMTPVDSGTTTVTPPTNGVTATFSSSSLMTHDTTDPNKVIITGVTVTLPKTKAEGNNYSAECEVKISNAILEGTISQFNNGNLTLDNLKVVAGKMDFNSINYVSPMTSNSLASTLPLTRTDITTTSPTINLGTTTIGKVVESQYKFGGSPDIVIPKPSILKANTGVMAERYVPIEKIENANSIIITNPGVMHYMGEDGSDNKFMATNASITISNAKITDNHGNVENADIKLSNVTISGDVLNTYEPAGSMYVNNLRVNASDATTAIGNLGSTYATINGLKLADFTIDSAMVTKAIPTPASLASASAASTVGRPAYDFTNASMKMEGGALDIKTKTMVVESTDNTGTAKTTKTNIASIDYGTDKIKVEDFGTPKRDLATGDVTFSGATITISDATIKDNDSDPAKVAQATADITVKNVTISGTPNPITSAALAGSDSSSISLDKATFVFPSANTATNIDNYTVNITSPTAPNTKNAITKIDMGATSTFRLDDFVTTIQPQVTIDNVKTSYPLSGGVAATSTFTFVTGSDLLNSTVDITLPNLRLDSRKFTTDDGSIISIQGLISTLNTPYNILNQKLDNLPDLQSKADATNSIALVNALKDVLIKEINALGAQQQRFMNITDQLGSYTEGMSTATDVFLAADLPKEAEIASQSKASIDITISALQNLNSLAASIARIVTG